MSGWTELFEEIDAPLANIACFLKYKEFLDKIRKSKYKNIKKKSIRKYKNTITRKTPQCFFQNLTEGEKENSQVTTLLRKIYEIHSLLTHG